MRQAGHACTALAACIALVCLALAGGAHAAEVRGTIAVSARVVATCNFAVSVPRAASPERATGTGSFSIRCTRGASATTVAQPAHDTAAPSPLTGRRLAYEVTREERDGTVIASVLF